MPSPNVLLASYDSIPGTVIRVWYDCRGKFVVGTLSNARGTDCFYRVKGDVLECGTSQGWQTVQQLYNRMGAETECEAICWSFFMRAHASWTLDQIEKASKDPFWKRLIDDSKVFALSSDVMLT